MQRRAPSRHRRHPWAPGNSLVAGCSSYSLNKGGATAANAAGISRAAIFELSNTSERTLAENYIFALIVPFCTDWFFSSRLHPVQAGRVAAVLQSAWHLRLSLWSNPYVL